MRGRAYRMMQINAEPRSKRFFDLLKKAVEQKELIPVEIVYCADKPMEIDMTLCVITKEQMIKFIRDSGLKDYGRTVARMMGESGEQH